MTGDTETEHNTRYVRGVSWYQRTIHASAFAMCVCSEFPILLLTTTAGSALTGTSIFVKSVLKWEPGVWMNHIIWLDVWFKMGG
jgi:hypothetical protein